MNCLTRYPCNDKRVLGAPEEIGPDKGTAGSHLGLGISGPRPFLGLGREMGPTNQPQQMCMPLRREPPSTFSVVLRGRHRPPNSPFTDVRDLGVPLDMTFTRSAHCKEAAITARRLLFMVRRSFCELSKTAFTLLYCALVRPHLEYAMEANVPTLKADIKQLDRV